MDVVYDTVHKANNDVFQPICNLCNGSETHSLKMQQTTGHNAVSCIRVAERVTVSEQLHQFCHCHMLATLRTEVIGIHCYRNKVTKTKSHHSPHSMCPSTSLPVVVINIRYMT